MPDELERQVERGSLFTHTALTEQALRANENEAIVNGLVDVLVRHHLVSADELLEAVDSARAETAAAGEAASIGVAIRVDAESTPAVAVDCAARMSVLPGGLLPAALRAHRRGDRERPAQVGSRPPVLQPPRRRTATATVAPPAHTSARSTTTVPTVCREYSCANDPRIWTDFDAMVLNDEWIAQHTGPDVPGPIEAFMHASLS